MSVTVVTRISVVPGGGGGGGKHKKCEKKKMGLQTNTTHYITTKRESGAEGERGQSIKIVTNKQWFSKQS